ncbi:MAG: uroporphyrinogen decarboxylase [Calditrichota bacterium]
MAENTDNRMYLRAARGESLTIPPVWLMRQAGRYLPEYNAVRKQHEFLEVCRTPELACEVTLQPIRRFRFDAAILFSDILVPLVPMGADLTFGKGHGPVIANPLRSTADVARIRTIEPRQELADVLKTIKILRAELPDEVALIGFAGAPFTLAAYWVEGGKPQPFAHLMGLAYSNRKTFDQLLDKLAAMVADYLSAMIDAGADAIQLFDTWAGNLSDTQFRDLNLPVVQRIFKKLSVGQVPMTYFVHGGMHLLRAIKDTGCTVVSLDWRSSLHEARALYGSGMALQGNFDPTILLGDEPTVRREVRRTVRDGNRDGGYIFNLGHGILPMTPISSVEILLDEIRNGDTNP